ncbi:MAG: PAS domain S-box protein, partial [Planctomycetaceae bacterium]|nr:PAS domain S-box protein [Planctomycetaceae bacterium]
MSDWSETPSQAVPAELQLSCVLQHLPFAAYACDADGLITSFNAQAAQLWGRLPRSEDRSDRFCGFRKVHAKSGELIAPEHSAMALALRTGNPQVSELSLEPGRATQSGWRFHVTPWCDPAGKVGGALGVFIDISDQLQAEQALLESEQRFVAMMQHVPGMAWIKDSLGRYVFAKDSLTHALGIPREELCGKTDAEVLPSQTAREFQQNDALAAASPAGIRTVETLTHSDGSVHQSIVCKFPLPDTSDSAGLVAGVAIDVTDLLRHEATLRSVSAFQAAVIRTAAEGICVCFNIPVFPYVSFSIWNHRMTELTGYTLDEINRLGWYQTMYPDPLISQQAQERMARMRHGDDLRNEEWQIIRKDGECRTISISTSVVESDHGRQAVVALIQDVTERQRAAESQRQRLLELSVLNRIGEICSSETTPDGILDAVTQVIAGALYPDNCGFLLLDEVRGVLVTHRSFVLTAPNVSTAEKPLGTGIVGQVALTGRSRRVADVSQDPDYLAADSRTRSELCVPMKRGTRVLGVLNVESQRLGAFSAADEQLLCTVAELVGNALERLAAEQAQRDGEERYRAILEGLPAGVFLHDGREMFYANPRALQIMGVDSLETLSRISPLEIVAPEYRDLARQRVEVLLQTGAHLPSVEAVILRPDGTRVDVEVTSQRSQFGGRACVQVLFIDITQRKRAVQAASLFRTLTDHVDDCMEVIDAQTGRFLDVNESACRAHGYTREEYLALTIPDVDPIVGAQPWPEIRDGVIHSGSIVIESLHRRRDGSTFPVEVNCTHVRLERDYFLAVVRDISERKRTEAALRESEERVRLALQGAQGGAWDWDLRGTDGWWSPEMYELWGIPRRDRIQFADVVTGIAEADRARVQESFLRAMDTDVDYECEFRIHHPTRGERWISARGCPLIGTEGRPSRLVGVSLDVTERKRAEQRLVDSERLLRLVMDVVPHFIFAKNRDGRFLFVNRFTAEANGFATQADMVGVQERLHSANKAEAAKFLLDDQRVIDTGSPLHIPEETVTDARGRTRVVQTSKIPFTMPGTNEPAVLGIAIDITDRVQAEQELRVNQERLRLAVAATKLGPWDWDLRTNVAVLSPEWKQQLGYEDHEIANRFDEWQSRLHPDDRSRVLDAIQAHLADARSEYAVEFRLRHKDGSYRWIYTQGVALRDNDGTPVRMLGCHVDVTERKQIESALRESEERLRIFVENAPAGVAMLDRDLRYLAYSRRWLSDYGLGEQNLVGRSHYEVFPEISDRWKVIHRRCLTGVSERCEDDRFERADGSVEHLRWEIQPWYDSGGAVGGLVLLTELISERVRARQKLRDSEERLLSVIRHAPGVAIQWYDAAGKVILWNAASEAIFGFTAAEAVGKTLDQLIHTPEEFVAFRHALATISQSGQSVGPTEYTFRRRDG